MLFYLESGGSTSVRLVANLIRCYGTECSARPHIILNSKCHDCKPNVTSGHKARFTDSPSISGYPVRIIPPFFHTSICFICHRRYVLLATDSVFRETIIM